MSDTDTKRLAVWNMHLMPSGDVTAVGTFIQLSGGIGPDGMALTAEGGLVMAHPRMGAVWVFDARGEPRWRVNSCGGDLLTNVVFGGPDMQTLHITDAGASTIKRVRLPVAGRLMYSHQ